MNEAKTQKGGTNQSLSVDVRIYPATKEGNLLAFASVTLGGCFAVNNIRIMNSVRGAFVAMPNRQDANGEYRDICCPTTAEMRRVLNDAVMGEYRRVMGLAKEQGPKEKTSVHDALQNTQKKEPPAKEAEKPAKQPAKRRKASKEAR